MPCKWIPQLCLVVCLASSSWADEILRVGIPKEGYPPYIVVDADQVTGIMIDTLEAAAKVSYFKLSYIYLPEVRSRAMLAKNEIDLRMESPSFVENPNDYLWSEPITSIKDMFIFHRHSENVFEKYDTMEGAIIHTHLGYGYPTLQPLFDQGIIIRKDFNTEQAMLVNLIRDNIHSKRAAVMDQNVAKYLMEKDTVLKTDLRISRRHIDYNYLHFQFPNNPKMKLVVNKLNLEIRKLKRSGRVDKIIKKMIGE